MKTQEKQKKILSILKTFPTKRLDEITKGDFHFHKLTKQESFWFMECVWINLGKTQATDIELRLGIGDVYALLILENLKRHGLIKLNKKGIFEKTKLGNEVKKLINKKLGGKTHGKNNS